MTLGSIPERIKQFNGHRLPAYTSLKYQMMAENPFRFFRGTCHLFYEDLAAANPIPPSPLTWICGDLHLENFGSYKGDNRLVYFDLNDFDEAALAPAAWELLRMLASIYTGFESMSIKKKEAARLARLFLETYSATLGKGRARYVEDRIAKGIVRLFLDKVAERKQKELIRLHTYDKNDKLALRIDKIRLFSTGKTLKKELTDHLAQWIRQDPHLQNRYRVIDAAFRVAGTGSLGVKRYVFLIQNREEPKKHLLIDMKQALPSSLLPWLPVQQPAWGSEAHRVVAIQERMQNVSPALLGTTAFMEEPYVIKEMQPVADKIDFMVIRDRYKEVERVIADMAILTASSHLRSAGRQGSVCADELIEFGNNPQGQENLLGYAMAYSGQVQDDYQSFFAAYKAGYFRE